jgi:putative Holliday junction resolvase
LIGVDLGERRIGVAVAEEPGPRARPFVTIRRGTSVEADAAALRLAAGATDLEVVLGLPLDASGAEGPMVEATRAWATELAAITGWSIVFRDERLSSHRAEERLGPMKRGRSGGPPSPTQRGAYRERVDREAAAIILQDELDARAVAEPARERAGGGSN